MQAGTYEFKVGDKAIYPKQGVTEVVSIEERKIGTATMELTCCGHWMRRSSTGSA